MQHLMRPGAQIAFALLAVGFLLYGGASFADAAATQENKEWFGESYEPAGPMIVDILIGMLSLGVAALLGMAIMRPSWEIDMTAGVYALLFFMTAAGTLAGQAAYDDADIEPKYWIVAMIAGALVAAAIFFKGPLSPGFLVVGGIMVFAHAGIIDDAAFHEIGLLIASWVFLGLAAITYGAGRLSMNPRPTWTAAASIGMLLLGLLLNASFILDNTPFEAAEHSEGAFKASLLLQGIGSIFLVVACAGVMFVMLILGLLKLDQAGHSD